MNRPMPARNRRGRGIDSCRTSRSSGTFPGPLGLVHRTPPPSGRATPPGGNPAAQQWGKRRSSFYGIAALAALGVSGRNSQTQLFAHGPRQESSYGVGLPPGSFHQFRERGSVRPFQQVQYFGRLAPLTGATRFLRALWRFLGGGSLSWPPLLWRTQLARAVRQHEASS